MLTIGIWTSHCCVQTIERVGNIPTMQFCTGIAINIQSKCYMQSLTEYTWDFRNDALWDGLYKPFRSRCFSKLSDFASLLACCEWAGV